MGTIKQGILGGFNGKVGTVIGASWKGITYMRGIAASISNPKTEAQLDQRARFATTLQFVKPLISFLRIGFKNQAVKMSAYNAAFSYNIKNALSGAYPDYLIDYPSALVSMGTLPGALNPAIASTVTGEVNFTWENNSTDSNAADSDKALLVVYNPSKKRSVNVVGGNSRASGSQIVTVPASFTGDEVQCYVGFQNANQSVVSNSEYAGPVVVH